VRYRQLFLPENLDYCLLTTSIVSCTSDCGPLVETKDQVHRLVKIWKNLKWRSTQYGYRQS